MAFPDPLLHPIAFSTPRRLTTVTPWQEHTPFAMYLVDLLRPATLVELGTHSGDSYCAFCQAVAELQLPTAAYAVDTWEGDDHAGTYTGEVLDDLRAHHDPLYGGFSELVQSTFDEARPRFQEGTIDLLHIDGCHRYEAARHDFDSWLPALSPRGVVLLHDTVRRLDDFGVWQLLDELRDRYPSLEFVHGNGLAMLLVGDERAPDLLELTRLGEEALASFRALFAALGSGVRWRGERQRGELVLNELRAAMGELSGVVEELGGAIDASEAELARQEQRVARLERHVDALQEEVTSILNSRLLRLGRRLRPGSGGG